MSAQSKIVFVGERRSLRAIQMNVTWQDGRLAAKVLFEALATLGITEDVYVVVNAYRDDGSLDVSIMEGVQTLLGQSWLIVRLGKKAQQALTLFAIPHRPMIHPAARGRIRRRKAYQAHVAEVLKEQADDQRCTPRPVNPTATLAEHALLSQRFRGT